MTTFAERMKKSALNFDKQVEEKVIDKEIVAIKPINSTSSNQPIEVKKESLKDDMIAEQSRLELKKVKKELEEAKLAYKKLEDAKVTRKSFKNYKARTVRITEEQEEMIQSFYTNLPKNVDRFENVRINSFVRAIFENVKIRKHLLDFDHIATEDDIFNEISNLFK